MITHSLTHSRICTLSKPSTLRQGFMLISPPPSTSSLPLNPVEKGRLIASVSTSRSRFRSLQFFRRYLCMYCPPGVGVVLSQSGTETGTGTGYIYVWGWVVTYGWLASVFCYLISFVVYKACTSKWYAAKAML